MRLLVTGHCGFIGQNFVRMYHKQHQIVGIDKMGYASDKEAANFCTKHLELDIARSGFEAIFDDINEQYGPFDAIVNFAAESHVDNSIKSPDVFIQSNIIGTFNLLEAARKHNVKKFIQIGTDEVYGDLMPDDPPFPDLHIMKPSSPYSASKASADLLALSYHRTYGLDVVVTRSCNNYGPYQHGEKFIPVIITKALNNETIPVYGTGLNMREWIYVEDNCEGVMKAVLNGTSGSIYNLGSGEEKTNLDLVREILSNMGKPLSLIEMVEDRKGHDFRYFLDSDISYDELDWKPDTEFSKGIRETIDHYESKS
jgi:dTDP-glucose 4,6-dehydratase